MAWTKHAEEGEQYEYEGPMIVADLAGQRHRIGSTELATVGQTKHLIPMSPWHIKLLF